MGRQGGPAGRGDDEGHEQTRYAVPGPVDDLLPDQTSDDDGAAWGERRETDDELLQRYLAERPPHHGG